MSTKINLLVLTPLLRMAVDQHGEEAAKLVESSTPGRIAMDAVEMVRLGYTHIVDNACSEENEFAAERLAEAAMMLLCAAKMLHDGVSK